MEGPREVKYERELSNAEIEEIKLACKKAFDERLVFVRERQMTVIQPHFYSIVPKTAQVGEKCHAIWVLELNHLMVEQKKKDREAGITQTPAPAPQVLRPQATPRRLPHKWTLRGAEEAGLLGNSARDRRSGAHLEKD